MAEIVLGISGVFALPAAGSAAGGTAAAVLGEEVTIWHWVAFGTLVFILLVLDLFVFHRHSREPTLRQSAMWTLVWCGVALAFNGLIWVWRGQDMAIFFLTGYVVEWTLSVDNVFVFAVIFSFFGVPLRYQYRVLFWGILGAIVLRLTFILIGAALIQKFGWVLPIFGVFLIYTGIKLAMHSDTQVDPENNLLLRVARRLFPIAREDYGEKFFAIENGKRCITPLFLVLLVVESTDVLFAVDSVPAILGITQDSFIVFTSNIFAILGLRALYFLLAGVINIFRYLNYGLAGVLIFVGGKMVADYWVGDPKGEHHLIPPVVSLLIIVGLLGISIAASVIASRREAKQAPGLPPGTNGP